VNFYYAAKPVNSNAATERMILGFEGGSYELQSAAHLIPGKYPVFHPIPGASYPELGKLPWEFHSGFAPYSAQIMSREKCRIVWEFGGLSTEHISDLSKLTNLASRDILREIAVYAKLDLREAEKLLRPHSVITFTAAHPKPIQMYERNFGKPTFTDRQHAPHPSGVWVIALPKWLEKFPTRRIDENLQALAKAAGTKFIPLRMTLVQETLRSVQDLIPDFRLALPGFPNLHHSPLRIHTFGLQQGVLPMKLIAEAYGISPKAMDGLAPEFRISSDHVPIRNVVVDSRVTPELLIHAREHHALSVSNLSTTLTNPLEALASLVAAVDEVAKMQLPASRRGLDGAAVQEWYRALARDRVQVLVSSEHPQTQALLRQLRPIAERHWKTSETSAARYWWEAATTSAEPPGDMRAFLFSTEQIWQFRQTLNQTLGGKHDHWPKTDLGYAQALSILIQ
jgi:hypothetical protein